jgi:hypothetical protein
MQTIDEVREHCRFVGKGIEKMVAEGEDLRRAGGGFFQVLLCLKGLL